MAISNQVSLSDVISRCRQIKHQIICFSDCMVYKSVDVIINIDNDVRVAFLVSHRHHGEDTSTELAYCLSDAIRIFNEIQ